MNTQSQTISPMNVYSLTLRAEQSRYRVTVMRSRYATPEWAALGFSPVALFVSDAEQISDADVLAGEQPPVIFQADSFDALEKTLGWFGIEAEAAELDALRDACNDVVRVVA